jgi:serine/threonine protein kinase
VIHRDLKPQNIMMNKRGEVVIMDFGLAAIADQLSGAEVRNGTPAYMAPEQLKGSEVTAKSDIYSLGLVLYELFTGKKPFDAKNVRQLLEMQESTHLPSMTQRGRYRPDGGKGHPPLSQPRPRQTAGQRPFGGHGAARRRSAGRGAGGR